MNVPVKEFNQEGTLLTHQQEDLKIRSQMSTIRDGEMKLIKEVLEAPTAQSDVGHATNLGTKHKIVGMI